MQYNLGLLGAESKPCHLLIHRLYSSLATAQLTQQTHTINHLLPNTKWPAIFTYEETSKYRRKPT